MFGFNVDYTLRNLYFQGSLRHTMAWRSTCGFQLLSYKITMSAVARLIPKPPALVLNMKTNLELSGML